MSLLRDRERKSDRTTTSINIKAAEVSQAIQEVTIQMQSLYQIVLQAKTVYDAARY